MQKLCVLGLGYIGLPTAAMLASHGYAITGVDIENELLLKLAAGDIYIEEPELDITVKKLMAEGGIKLSPVPVPADAYIIAVPTPCQEDKSCDLTYVLAAVESILPVAATGNVIIIESTVPPHTCDRIIKPVLEAAGFKVGADIHLAYCPERVLPGNIMQELTANNRIIGGCTRRCASRAAEIFKSFVNGQILLTDAKTAEMTKLLENSFRDVNIALANEITQICHHLGINALEVIRLANQHPRVNVLDPGPGVGGHCLAVDPYFIIEKAPALSKIIAQARQTNSGMPQYIAGKVKKLLNGVDKARIAVFGISYKGNVSDLRESPALAIIEDLVSAGYRIAIYDPYVYADNHAADLQRAVENADMILILADHQEFKSLDYDALAKQMRTPLVFDTKNVINCNEYHCSEIIIYNLGNVYCAASHGI